MKFNPDEDKQHLFVSGHSDKKIITVCSQLQDLYSKICHFISMIRLISYNIDDYYVDFRNLTNFLTTLISFQWDINSGEIVQEYDRHLGAVNTITFVDNNTKFVSTSDDKSLRVWEW